MTIDFEKAGKERDALVKNGRKDTPNKELKKKV